MKRILLAIAILCVVSVAEARTMVRVGMFGTKVRAGCGSSVYVGPCGQVQVGYGGGGCCAPACATPVCASGGCAQNYCGGGGCGQVQQCHSAAPFGVQCSPNYGTHTQTCTESFVPYGAGAAALIAPTNFGGEAAYGAQLRYRGY